VTDVLTQRLPRPRDVSGEFGIYVHVPFCSHRCWYCDFNAYAGLDHFADAYMEALVRDVELALSAPAGSDLAQRPPITSVFIGGGTPSLVPAASIARVVAAIRGAWDVAVGAEVTIECNPESLDAEKLGVYLDAGINRVSIGVQSLDRVLLERLGRTHTAGRALDALRLAHDSGFDNVSADLIFGIPGEDDDTWHASLDGVLGTGVQHVSAYALIYEDGTPLEQWRKLGKVIPVPDDDVADRWEVAERVLSAAGLERYEISNWCRPGRESRHNSLYWACGEYLGVGAGAHSHVATSAGAVRSWTVKGPERYVRAVTSGERPVAGSEEIDERTRGAETMLLGLRRRDGVALEDFAAVVGRPIEEVYGAELERGRARGLLDVRNGRVRAVDPLLLNESGVLFA
jgi:putative oxygen-independent coproporphyrinogen III oxidase